MSGFQFPWSRQLTPVLQAEAAECGLACLTMAANAFGHKTNLPGLRRRYSTSMKGATLAELMLIASDLELGPRPLRLELEELPELRLPAVLHWDLNHFVVLEKLAPGRAIILDPAIGRRSIGLETVSRHFTGVALEFQPTPEFRPREERSILRITDLWSKLTNYGGATAQVVLLSLLLQITALAMPLFMQLTIDEAIGQSDANLLGLLAIGFGTVYCLNAVIQGLRSWVVLTLGESLAYQLAGNITRHLIRLPLAYFERRHVGDLLSRIGSIRPIQDLLTQGLVNVAIDFLLALTTLIVMMLISVPLALTVVFSTLLYFGISLALFPRLRQRSEEEILARAQEETYLLETIRAMRAVKLHGSEAMRQAGWRNRNADVISANYRSGMIGIRLALAENILFSLQLIVVVYLGAQAVIDETMTIGLLLAFMSYRTSFSDSAAKLINQIQQWRMIALHLDRLSDIVGEQPEQIGIAPPRGTRSRPAAIRVEHLSFSYSPTERPILDDVSFEIPAGGFAAFVGPSGAGKTTLMRLLLGLLDPSSGRILIDGVPLGPATIAGWRARVGAVLQDDSLLTGTLGDNIGFFDTQLDMDHAERCARFARVHDDIAAMPMGYFSLIGDMGSTLSGGQRQRLLLARALYRKPDGLFLDEGTANLDLANETAISDAVSTLAITRVVIAHRPALIERAQQIFEVIDGKVHCTWHQPAAAPSALAG
ncbi:peptidase domain-containing ABC transporter [Sphingomonas sp. So64.6b]|uniref:peptidase domain-containing ABC transporter n=1 Tax=Sphingomonas sp. So64.6b TaxID=2997354 RepID=UPI001600A069|nr:peptidase domain-containing ABC transporter [Sphingomonas sp. So64.6b]QNA82857.1 peptidase domain-containing ABC transporter [Sphingomonas sp. So64.6b]